MFYFLFFTTLLSFECCFYLINPRVSTFNICLASPGYCCLFLVCIFIMNVCVCYIFQIVSRHLFVCVCDVKLVSWTVNMCNKTFSPRVFLSFSFFFLPAIHVNSFISIFYLNCLLGGKVKIWQESFIFWCRDFDVTKLLCRGALAPVDGVWDVWLPVEEVKSGEWVGGITSC